MSQPIRILHVEDTRVYRGVIERLLGQEPGKYDLRQVTNRSEFEAALAESEFDLVLTDLTLGDIGGLEVLDIVRAKHPDVPVIIVTGTGSEEIAVLAWKRGAADYVLKSPKHIQHLPVAIDAVMQKARLESERRQAEGKIQSQVVELQRWYQATLGREDRIRVLKREVNELCQRLGEPARYASENDDNGPTQAKET